MQFDVMVLSKRSNKIKDNYQMVLFKFGKQVTETKHTDKTRIKLTSIQ